MYLKFMRKFFSKIAPSVKKLIFGMCIFILPIAFYTLWYTFLSSFAFLVLMQKSILIFTAGKVLDLFYTMSLWINKFSVVAHKYPDMLVVFTAVFGAIIVQLHLFSIHKRFKKVMRGKKKFTKRFWFIYAAFSAINTGWALFLTKKTFFTFYWNCMAAIRFLGEHRPEMGIPMTDGYYLIFLTNKYFLLILLFLGVIVYILTTTIIRTRFSNKINNFLRYVTRALVLSGVIVFIDAIWKLFSIKRWSDLITLLVDVKSFILFTRAVRDDVTELLLFDVALLPFSIVMIIIQILIMRSESIANIRIAAKIKIREFANEIKMITLFLFIKGIFSMIALWAKIVVTIIIVPAVSILEIYALAMLFTIIILFILSMATYLINKFIFKKLNFLKNNDNAKVIIMLVLYTICLIILPACLILLL